MQNSHPYEGLQAVWCLRQWSSLKPWHFHHRASFTVAKPTFDCSVQITLLSKRPALCTYVHCCSFAVIFWNVADFAWHVFLTGQSYANTLNKKLWVKYCRFFYDIFMFLGMSFLPQTTLGWIWQQVLDKLSVILNLFIKSHASANSFFHGTLRNVFSSYNVTLDLLLFGFC